MVMKKKKIGLMIAGTIFVLLAILTAWQFHNLKAIYLFLTTDEQTSAQKMEETRQDHHEILEEQHAVTIKPPSLEQSSDLLDGKVTPEEVKETLGITPPVQTQPEQKTAEELKNECVAELYSLKVDVMGRLGTMKQEVLAQWKALSPHQRTREKKLELGYAALDECYDYEVEVDGQVKTILDKYRPQLKAIGADTSVMDTLWKYYCEEKASEKAYYLNKYL